ncbi:hypothetical protein HGO38_15035 [Rhizobium sp. CG5]|uniref:hypothetical protein n=1 Tax=Rhizobium sp. CG5 TaxID=2726076 RepID=UPI002033D426|nr:hypothetical protein [Rhizobium sp. CG5]MCM2474793.1 hypothetical protein [Rhizobium sp. CG5]
MSPQIDFAKRHIVSQVSTFNAASAIYRLEALIDDAKEVSGLLTPQQSHKTFEFVSYYQVGFVTCLEWHAKSRLYDLFVFDPKQISANDVKQGFSDAKLALMISEGLEIPHLIASGSSVSTYESYISTIDRVLTALGAKGEIKNLLGTDAQVIEDLYVSRNTLVHEIGIQAIGHPNVRDFSTFKEVLEQGNIVLSLIRGVEAQITAFASEGFPNQLDSAGYPVDEVGTLMTKIRTMEAAISDAIAEGNCAEGLTIDRWTALLAKSNAGLIAELEFIATLDLAGWQYFDVRPSLKAHLLRQRLKYLENLAKEII